MKCRNNFGLALITVLLITLPLIMMLTAALSLVGHGTFTSLSYQDRMEAFYAAEAGVVYAIDKLQTDGDAWSPSDDPVIMPNGRSSFRISLSSVNNLENFDPVDGPRGSDSVPPDSADLVVTGTSGVAERTLEVIVQRRGAIAISEPILASGRVRLNGNVVIRGFKDLNDWTWVPAGIHSNHSGDAPGIVRWTGSDSSLSDHISGDITVVSENPTSIQVEDEGTVAGEQLVGEPERPVKDFDIQAQIDHHSGGQAVPPPDANGVVTLADGDYYTAGGLEIVGKLNLENANLYVDGKLEVRGAVSGNGSIYVAETTTFRGDTRLNASDPNNDEDTDVGIGLFSKGNVELEGYDGEQYMNDLVSTLPSDHEVRRAWEDSQKALDEMVSTLETHSWNHFDDQAKADFDSYRRVLGQSEAFPGEIPSWASGQERLRVLVTALEAEPPGEVRNFLVEKFGDLADTFDAGASFYPGTGTAAKEAAIQSYITTGDTRGLLDSSLDFYYDGVPSPLDHTFRAASASVQQLHFDGLGNSYFQGVIYTEGYIRADTHVTVVGGILANGGSGDGPDLSPGDVVLSNGATIFYPVDVFKSGKGVGGTGQLGVTSWISR
jgi:hypothetical protein